METVYIQIRAPRGGDPGRVLEGHYNIVGDTVVLVDRTGKALTSDDQKYSRKLTPGDHPKQIAAELLRSITMQHGEIARADSATGYFIRNCVTDFLRD